MLIQNIFTIIPLFYPGLKVKYSKIENVATLEEMMEMKGFSRES